MQREFQIGSNWIYFKIYCGVKIADTILLEHFKDKISFLKQKRLIEKWFFIRYNDPDSHVRLRFLLTKNTDLAQVIATLTTTFEDLIAQHLIWKIQTDTYVRELERYGSSTYELTETLFETDSDLILEYLQLKNSFSSSKTPLLFSFLSIDALLQLFELTNQEKTTLLNEMQHSFKQEFNADAILKSELDKQYRAISKEISGVLQQKNEEYQSFFDIVNLKNNKIKPLITTNLEVTVFSFLTSQIHMMMNRQFTSRQREYELVIYDHLYRYYKTQYYIFK